MGNSYEKKFSEIINRETGKSGKKPVQSRKKKAALLVTRTITVLLIRGFLTGVSLLGVQWMLASAMPSLTVIQQMIPLWIATVGGLALNSLVSILASTARSENS